VHAFAGGKARLGIARGPVRFLLLVFVLYFLKLSEGLCASTVHGATSTNTIATGRIGLRIVVSDLGPSRAEYHNDSWAELSIPLI
jgi:hypothetical protein